MKPILGERQHRVLRGGRMTKWKGRAASMSPMLGQLVGSVSPLALALGAAITVSGGGAAAQDICTAAGGGVYNCAGPSTTEQALSVTSGSLTVNLDDTATVDAALGDAFDLRKYGGDGDLTFTQAPGGGAITGASDGISASNVGTGALSITATGAVTGDIDGILTVNFGTDLSITTESDVAGGNSGINATNQTDGALSITATGAVTGTQSFGIYANNRGGTTDVSVTAGSAVLGYISGIYTRNRGTGALEITATETVTGTTGDGIVGRNFGTNLSVTAGAAVLGGDIGIVARNNGTGVLEITTTGAVTGEAGRGIDAYAAASAAGDVTVTARGDVTGAREAILVDNQGGGATVVRAEGTLTGGGGYAALAASSAASGTDMIIEVVDATGATGIDANHLGTGDLTVTATGTVTGTAGDGINARNTDNADGGVTVNANVVTGSDRGIDASNYGSGALTISATGAVTGMGGIYADNNYSALTINATGSVTATNGFGIWARNEGTDLTINVAAVSSVYDGINAGNNTTGALSITATGAVTGESRNGIIARNGGGSAYYGTDLTITADAGVTGADDGINASNWGRGALSITTTGAVAGQGNDGIRARNGGFSYYGYAFGTDLTITAGGDVTGGMNGIVTDHRGTGALGVTMAGAVTGGTGAGVENAATSQGGQFVLQDGGSMQAESGLAFADLADGSTGDASSTLDIAGALNGDAQMGAGSDTLILRDTATLGAGITLDGDAGAESGIAGQIDRLEFAGWTGSFDAVQALNWESVVLSENAVVTFAEGSAAGTAAGDLTVEIGADATARLAGDFTLDGALANGGLLDLSTAAPSVGTQLRVTGDYSAASDLLIDADLSSGGGTDNTVEGDAAFTDQILIGGNVTGTTTVTVNNTGDGLALTDLDGNGQVDANEGLLFAQAQGDAAADSFVLAAPIIDGAFMAEVYSFGPDASVSGAWDYVLAVTGEVFSPAAPGYESLPYTLMGFAKARSLASRQGGQQWLVGGARAGGNGSPETAGGGGALDPGLALAPRRGIWIAAEGSRWDVTPQQSTTGLDFDLDLWRIRAGFETIAMEAASGTMTVGLNFFAGNGTLHSHAEDGSTSTSTDAYGGGLTLTWYGDDGLYADGQLSFVSSDSDISSGTLGTVATGVGGSATVLSVELGKRFGLQSGWTVIPQGQLSWASMSFDSFTGSSGETVTPEDWNSLLLRLGAAAERRWQVESGGQASFYGLANVNHEFNADTTVDVSGTKLTSKLPDWTAELGIGGAYDWNDGRGRLFGEVTVSEALGSGDLSGVSGTLGISLRF
jgi:outer membrane autotransporter protein